MNRLFARLALFGAALFLLLPSAARSETQDGQSPRGNMEVKAVGGFQRSDSTVYGLSVDTDGSGHFTDTDRDRDKVTLWQDLISNSSLAAAAGDSNPAPIDVHEYRYLKLLVKVTPIGAAANTTVRLAFQFRECMAGNSDSSSVFPTYLYGQSPVGFITASTLNDTTSAGHLITGSATQAWSGEYVVKFDMARSAPGLGSAANVWSYPNGVGIPLDSFFGRAVRFQWLQIRVRNLNASGPAVKINVSMLGFAE